jgi:hypothetical protein
MNFLRLLPLALVVFGSAGPVCGALNLTAATRDYIAQGIKYHELIFTDAERKVSMELPPKWEFRSTPSRIRFTIPYSPDTEATIELRPLPQSLEFDDTAMKNLLQTVSAALPAAATKITVEARPNPLLIDGHECLEVLASFTLSGIPYQKSVLIVNAHETQLVFQLSARQSEFSAVNKTFRSLVLSWHWSEPPQVTEDTSGTEKSPNSLVEAAH